MSYKERNMQEGFTLVEILIASALVMILGALATYSYRGILESNKKRSTIASMKTIRSALEQYQENEGDYPQSLNDLVNKPADEQAGANWDGPYMDKVPKDGWKQPFVYNLTEGGAHSYELYSKKSKGTPKAEWIDAWKQ